MVSCNDCGKDFETSESMGQHVAAKHAKVSSPASSGVRRPGKKLLFAVATVVAVLVVGYFVFFNISVEEKPVIDGDSPDGDYSINLDEVPKGPIHWHPKLSVYIKGELQYIPKNMGVSGAVEYPVHTHDDVPVLHYENNRPTPETMTLGYFINTVWRKRFDRNCIFDYCNGPEGNLTMTVNGEPSVKFDRYLPKDGDDIVIRFE